MKPIAENFEQLFANVQSRLEPAGFEAHPFKISWYNERVDKPFHLDYDPETVALIVLSAPKMFESTFLPFIHDHNCISNGSTLRDPLDVCMRSYFNELIKAENIDADLFYDFDMTVHRRPMVLMQTAGHVAGAAYYYLNTISKSALGVSIHPRYGGWFGFRTVIILKSITCPLERREPIDLLPEKENQLKLLNSFMYSWQSYEYRDCVKVVEKYSDRAMKYFATKPGERYDLVRQFINGGEDIQEVQLDLSTKG